MIALVSSWPDVAMSFSPAVALCMGALTFAYIQRKAKSTKCPRCEERGE